MKKLMVTVALMGTVAMAQQNTPPAAGTAQAAQTAIQAAAAVKVTLAQDQIKATTVDGKTVENVIASPKTVLPGDVLQIGRAHV